MTLMCWHFIVVSVGSLVTTDLQWAHGGLVITDFCPQCQRTKEGHWELLTTLYTRFLYKAIHQNWSLAECSCLRTYLLFVLSIVWRDLQFTKSKHLRRLIFLYFTIYYNSLYLCGFWVGRTYRVQISNRAKGIQWKIILSPSSFPSIWFFSPKPAAITRYLCLFLLFCPSSQPNLISFLDPSLHGKKS